MKKKISVLLCILTLVFCITGCGSKKETVEYDKEQLEQYSEAIISSFSIMDEAAFAQFSEGSELQVNLNLMQIGLPLDQKALISMIDSWKASVDECGEYKGHGDYTTEADKTGVVVSTVAEYEEREAVIAFKFDEHLRMESMDVSAKYELSEILQKAGMNTVLGMGTVFTVLIFLAFIISLMKYIPMMLGNGKKEEATKKEVVKATPVVEPAVEEVDDLELVAVITAAIAAQEGTSTDGFVVRSIKRRTSNKWV